MSDFCLYELDDLDWHEIYQSGDHVVPHPSSEESVYENSFKKPRHEESAIKQRLTTLENSPWSDADCVIPLLYDNGVVKDTSNLVSESSKTSNKCFKRNNADSVGSESFTNAVVDGDSYWDVFFDDKSLPETGNFEDFDRTLRSCGSTFGLGSSNEDELDWFSPSLHNISVNDTSGSRLNENGVSSEQIYTQQLHVEHKNQSKRKGEGVYLENIDSFPCSDNLLEEASQLASSPVDFQQQKRHKPDAFGYLQSNFACDQSSVQAIKVQENSLVGSESNDISEAAASIHQLQSVMQQLDLKTRLCIRDSLYRLARNAELRHKHANSSNDPSGASMANGTNKCYGYADIEAETNRIDRSIAHLLFHKLADSPVVPAVAFEPSSVADFRHVLR